LKVSGVSSYRWTILLLATLVQVGVSILQQAPAALGPVLIRDLDLSRAQIGLLSSAIWGGMLLGMLPVGLLIDRHGERRLIVAGVTAMALLVLWATQLRAFVLLLILFLLASIGAASSAPGGSKAIAAWFPSSRRGGAMGIRQTGVTIGGLAAARDRTPLRTLLP
jgi:sugar phosphate permease